MKFGQSQTRDEDAQLVRGAGQYAGDRTAPDALWMHVVRSDRGAGTITGIDIDDAKAMPGVHLVVTGSDPRAQALNPFNIRYVPPGTDVSAHCVRPLASDAVRYVGEPVAIVVAETRQQAMDAAEALFVDIDDADAVTDARTADTADSAQVWPEGNTIFEQTLGDRDAYDAALGTAAHIITARLDISCVSAVSLETRNGLAVPEGDGLTLYTGTQAPHRVRTELAHVLGMDEPNLRVVINNVGGAFGTRNGAYPEDALALLSARELNRPVRWAADRIDAFASDTQSRPQSVDVTLVLDSDLNFTALGVDGYAPVGAYIGPMSMHPMTSALPALAGVYRTPVLHTVMRGMYVNRMHMAPYRGAGRPEAIYVIERIIDIAAHRLGVDRVELRRRNMITPDQMPHKTPLGFVYDSGDFPAALERALVAADWAGFATRRSEAGSRGRLRGLGLACAIESAGAGGPSQQLPEFGRLKVAPHQPLSIAAGSGDAGQGHATSMAQMADQILGWQGPVEVTSGDTATVPKGLGTFGSRTMGALAQTLTDAGAVLLEEAKPDAAAALGVEIDSLDFRDGAFRVPGTNRFVTLETLSNDTGNIYQGAAFSHAKSGTFPNGVHLAEVEIDPETGALELVHYTVVDDVGTIVNPLLLAGQIHGGVAQGLGQAFLEQIVYDEDGALLTASLMDYALPRADTMAPITMEHSPTETDANPMGIKGAGESGAVGALSAGLSAVHDALASLGVENVPMPATPHRIWQAIQAAHSDQGDLS